MKTVNEISNQEPVFLELFQSRDDVFYEFERFISSSAEYVQERLEYHNDKNILFAYYSYEDYYGEAFVLFEKGGVLYTVSGSHCSCYGLEGQWEPDETSVEALKHLLIKGWLGRDGAGSNFDIQLSEFLGVDLSERKEAI